MPATTHHEVRGPLLTDDLAQRVRRMPVPHDALDRDTLLAHLRGRLAPHKLPRLVVPVDTIGRAPNGKADYAALARRAAQAVKE